MGGDAGNNYDRLASHPGGKDSFTPWKPEYVVWQFGLFGVLHKTRTVFFSQLLLF